MDNVAHWRPRNRYRHCVGSLSNTTGFISVTPQSLESSDSLTNNNPQRIDFDLRTASPWMNHFEITTQDSDALCIKTDGQPLFIAPVEFQPATGRSTRRLCRAVYCSIRLRQTMWYMCWSRPTVLAAPLPVVQLPDSLL